MVYTPAITTLAIILQLQVIDESDGMHEYCVFHSAQILATYIAAVYCVISVVTSVESLSKHFIIPCKFPELYKTL